MVVKKISALIFAFTLIGCGQSFNGSQHGKNAGSVLVKADSTSFGEIFADKMRVRKGSVQEGDLESLETFDESHYMEIKPNLDKRARVEFLFSVGDQLDDVTDIELFINFKGKQRSKQRWLFYVFNFNTRRWVKIGDNRNIQSGLWNDIGFLLPNNIHEFINDRGRLRTLILTKKDSLSSAYIDYFAIRYVGDIGTPMPVPSDCGSLAHGESERRIMYKASQVPHGSTCQSEVQTRTCNDGQLSNYTPSNYQHNSCSVEAAPTPTPVPSSCGSLAHGESERRTMYKASQVPHGSTCQSEVQTRTCNDGQLSNYTPSNYQHNSCSVEAAPTPTPVPSDCGRLAHGESERRTMYKASQVPHGSTCQSEVQTRTCNDGQLSNYTPSNYQYNSCSVEAAPTPTPGPAPTVTVSNRSELLQALSNASGGEVIGLHSGSYGVLDLRGRGFSSAVTIQSVNASNAALFERIYVRNSSNIKFVNIAVNYKATGYTPAIAIFESSSISVIGSEVYGNVDSDHQNDAARGFYVRNSNSVLVQGNSVHDFLNGLYVQNTQNFDLIGNKIFNHMSDGIQLTSVQNVLIENNEIFENFPNAAAHSDLIQIFDANNAASTDVTIRGNFLHEGRGASAQALFISNPSTGYQRFLIENNIIYNAIPHGISARNLNNSTVRNNTVLTVPGKRYISSITITGGNNVIRDNITTMLVIDGTTIKNPTNNIIADYKNSSNQYFYDKLYVGGFDGDNVSIQSFMPISGSVADFGSNMGAEKRIKKMLGL